MEKELTSGRQIACRNESMTKRSQTRDPVWNQIKEKQANCLKVGMTYALLSIIRLPRTFLSISRKEKFSICSIRGRAVVKILILSPHTDDAELGAGGALFKFLENGNELYWIVFSAAQDSLPDSLPKDTLKKEFLDVIGSIGIGKDMFKAFDYRVRYLHEYRQEILEEMVSINREFSPDLVIGPSLHDHHQDHQVVAGEMIRAFKRSSSIISYELPWNHIEFNTQLFVRLERTHIERKFQLLRKYRSQIMLQKPYFDEEFIFGWAKMRGIQIGSSFAEAFEVARWII
jgi:LmbE family N-acetylglucosaminyl deacetylase